MVIELLCRYPKDPASEDFSQFDEELDLMAVIQGDNFNREKERNKLIKKENVDKFEYGPFSFDLKDIVSFNMVDADHTCVRMYGNVGYVFKINYDEFRTIYQTLSGRVINDFSNIVFKKPENDTAEG